MLEMVSQIQKEPIPDQFLDNGSFNKWINEHHYASLRLLPTSDQHDDPKSAIFVVHSFKPQTTEDEIKLYALDHTSAVSLKPRLRNLVAGLEVPVSVPSTLLHETSGPKNLPAAILRIGENRVVDLYYHEGHIPQLALFDLQSAMLAQFYAQPVGEIQVAPGVPFIIQPSFNRAAVAVS